MNNGTLFFHYMKFMFDETTALACAVLIGPPTYVDENIFECEVGFENMGNIEPVAVRANTEMHALWAAMAEAGRIVQTHPAADYLDVAALPNFGFPLPPPDASVNPPE